MSDVLITVRRDTDDKEMWQRRFSREEFPYSDPEEIRQAADVLLESKKKEGILVYAQGVFNGYFSYEENKEKGYETFLEEVLEKMPWKEPVLAGARKTLTLSIIVEVDGIATVVKADQPDDQTLDQWLREGFEKRRSQLKAKVHHLPRRR